MFSIDPEITQRNKQDKYPFKTAVQFSQQLIKLKKNFPGRLSFVGRKFAYFLFSKGRKRGSPAITQHTVSNILQYV